MEQLVITRNNQYEIAGEAYFQYRNGEFIYRDLRKDFTKCCMFDLKILAKFLKIKKYSKMKKAELVNAMTPLVYFE